MSNSKKPNRTAASYGWFLAAAGLVGLAPAVLTFAIDPYEMFATSHQSKTYRELAEKAHYPLWKFIHYHGKADTVVLGDSRARALRNKYWHELGASKVYNFAYGGGTIPEIHATFRQIKDEPTLKNLVVGIQLRSFDENHKGGLNRVPEAIKASASTASYLKNWFVARKSLDFFSLQNESAITAVKQVLPSVISNASAADLGMPGTTGLGTLLRPDVCFGCDFPEQTHTKGHLWTKGPNLGLGRGNRYSLLGPVRDVPKRSLPVKFENQVRKNARSDWKAFIFSNRYLNMMQEMANWANAREDRSLTFVIPPTIVEMQHTISAYGLSAMDLSMRRKLARMAPIVDFDFPNLKTREIGNFTDAYHFNSKLARQMIAEIIMVRGASVQQAKTIAKRRVGVECPPLALMKTRPASSFGNYVEGDACRVWTGAQNG